jgi:hypothetical protein
MAAACSTGEPVPEDAATRRCPTCVPEVEDHGLPPSGAAARGLGTAVGSVRYTAGLFSGTTPQPNLLVLGGAPISTVGPNDAYVRAYRVNPADGNLLPDAFTLTDPDGGAFGEALAGIDLVGTQTDFDRGPWSGLAAGDEIVVGDPDPWAGPGQDTGRIHWFHSEYQGLGPSDEQAWDKYRWVEGGTFRPSGLATGAGFGASIAAPSHALGAQPDWVAVGAPGENAVYVLEVDASWTSVLARIRHDSSSRAGEMPS